MSVDKRYYILDDFVKGEPHKIVEASEAIGFDCVGLVDEQAGVIAYGAPEYMLKICKAMNAYANPD